MGHLAKAENERERVVNGALLGGRKASGTFTEPLDVDGPELLDQHARSLAFEIDRGTKRGRGGAAGRGSDDCRGKREQLVRLHDHRIASAGLLAPTARRKTHSVDLAASHSGQSAVTASMSAITARRSRASSGSAAKRRTSSASADR